MGYNASDRLTSASRTGDNQVFTVDTVGNRTGHTRSSTGANLTYALQGGANRLARFLASSAWRPAPGHSLMPSFNLQNKAPPARPAQVCEIQLHQR